MNVYVMWIVVKAISVIRGKKERCKYITFSPTSVLSVTKYKKIESANCGQANVTVTEIKTEIKRGDCNTVKPADLPFLWLWVENIKSHMLKLFVIASLNSD